ncbi:MAG: APC family permease [Bacteroidales bacterium]
MLRREIRRWDLVLLMINSIIGAGIFGLPAIIYMQSGIYSVPALLLCALFIIIIAFCFAEVASRFRKTGGPYLYALESFGEIPAVGIGWILLITRLSTYAAHINLMITFAGYFNPAFDRPVVRAVSIILITLFLTTVTYRGIRSSTLLSNILAIAKILPLLIFVAVGAFFFNPELVDLSQPAPRMSDLSSSVFVLIFAFTGFEAVLVNTGEVKNPRRDIPFALISSIIFVAIFYALIQAVCIGTLPDLASSERPLTDAAAIFMGPFGASLITIGAIVSIGGAINAVMLIGSRIPYAFSEEKQFPKLFIKLHPKYRTPVWSLLAFAVTALIVSLTGTFVYAVAISVISKTLILMTVCAALIKLRLKEKKSVKPAVDYFRIKHGYLVASIGILSSLWLLKSSRLNEITAVLITILFGLILYFLYKLTNHRR